MSYLEFANRVKNERRYAWDDEVEVFLEAVLATSESRTRRLPSGAVLWRAQLGVDWHYDPSEGIEQMGFGPDRMKPIARIVREGRANSSGYSGTVPGVRRTDCYLGNQTLDWLKRFSGPIQDCP